jgi:hypothetical protein
VSLTIEVLHTRWSCDHGEFDGGVHEIAKPKAGLVEQVAAAAALSDPPLRVVSAGKAERARMKGAVQSQAEGERAYAEAQRTGKWHVGNVEDRIARGKATLAAADDPDNDFELSEERYALEERIVAQSERIREHMKRGRAYYDAVAATLADEQAGR